MKRAISYCVWGDQNLYNYGLYENALLLPKIFPGWEMIIYYTKTANLKVIKELNNMENVKCFEIDIPDTFRNSMLRFMAGFAKNYDATIFRDADSRLLKRDFSAVQEWLKSNKPFHIMRDHPNHGNKISAGLWGVRNRFFVKHLEIKNKYFEYLQDKNLKKWTIDEQFLQKEVYPYVNQNNSIIHASFHRKEIWAKDFPNDAEERRQDNFCGKTFGWTENASKKFNDPIVHQIKKRVG